jgi:uncharacterized linocin/CFP29 family protein
MSNMNINMDFIGKGGAVNGQFANSRLLANNRMDPGVMRPYLDKDLGPVVSVYVGGPGSDPNDLKNYRVVPIQTNATLRRDEWKQLDDVVLKIVEQRLGGVDDLISKGLTYDLGNGMGTTVLEWHDVSDALEAELTMDGISRANNDRPNYETNYLPLPIIHVDYTINMRALDASRNSGNPIDTTLAERAARKVREYLEKMLFTDITKAYGGGTIYSYLNYPHRNQVTLSTNWDDLSATSTQSVGEQIIDDVQSMKQSLLNAHYYGPYTLYVPTNYETLMDKDYNVYKNNTIRERILQLNNITDVKVVDFLPDDNVLLVQMTNDVVRLVRGMGLTNVEWQSQGNMVTDYKVMTIQVPQIRSDQNNKCGIAHLA